MMRGTEVSMLDFLNQSVRASNQFTCVSQVNSERSPLPSNQRENCETFILWLKHGIKNLISV